VVGEKGEPLEGTRRLLSPLGDQKLGKRGPWLKLKNNIIHCHLFEGQGSENSTPGGCTLNRKNQKKKVRTGASAWNFGYLSGERVGLKKKKQQLDKTTPSAN